MASESESNVPRAKVELTGTPEQIAQVVADKRVGNGQPTETVDEFYKLITAPSNDVAIHVDRISPKEWKGRDISGWTDEFVPPTSLDDIQECVRRRYGGGRYRIRVMKAGRLVANRGIEIAGEPKTSGQQDDDDKVGNVHVPYGASYGAQTVAGGYPRPPLVQDINRDPEVLAKRKEIELLKLDKERRKYELENQQPTGEDKYEKLLRELTAKHEREMAEVRRLVAEKEQESKFDRLRSEMLSVVKGLEEKLEPERKSGTALKELRDGFDQKFGKLQSELAESVKVIRDTKERDRFEEVKKHVDEMRREIESKLSSSSARHAGMGELKEYANILGTVLTNSTAGNRELVDKMFSIVTEKVAAEPKNETGRFAEFLEMLAMAQDVMGGREEPPEPPEPKDFGTAFLEVVKDAIPQIADAVKGKNGTASREEIEQIVRHNIDMATKKAAASIARRQQQQSLPTQTGQPMPTAPLDPAQDRRVRVTTMLREIAKELPSRPRVTHWLNYAFYELPPEVLDAVAQCTTPKMFVDICMPDADPGIVAFVRGQLADEAKNKWFADTLTILRREYAKLKAESVRQEVPVPATAPVAPSPVVTSPPSTASPAQNPPV
jgi:hypothetical protein